jgi:hypothetical protein
MFLSNLSIYNPTFNVWKKSRISQCGELSTTCLCMVSCVFQPTNLVNKIGTKKVRLDFRKLAKTSN